MVKLVVFSVIFIFYICNTIFIFADSNIKEYKNMVLENEEIKNIKETVPNIIEKFLNLKENKKNIDILIKYDIIDDKSLYKEKITKSECIKSILKVIGVFDELAKYYEEHVNFVMPVFEDLPSEKFGYLTIAKEYGLALGEKCGKYRSKIYPDRNVTLDECLSVMNKCLDKELSSNMITQAKNNGLLKDTDEILKRDDKTLSYEDFCVLLYRMFTHKRGYYFYTEPNIIYEEKLIFDYGEKIRYIDFHDSLKNNRTDK